MEEFKVKYEQPYKDKPRSERTQKFLGFIDRQKYFLLSLLIFISLISAKIWSMTIDPNISLKDITFQLVLYGVLNYLIYYFMSSSGRDRGRISPQYLEAKNKYAEIHDKIRVGGLYVFLQPFCLWKKKTVTEEYRRDCLMDSTLTYEEYVEKYQGRNSKVIKEAKLDKETRRCILEANAYKPPKLQASTLWQKSTFNEQVKFISRSGLNVMRVKRVFKILSIMIFSFISVSIKTETTAHFDWSLIIDVLMCASAAFLGYRGGFEAYAYTEVSCYETKTEILNEAYDWIVEKQKENEGE